jgi:thiol:disulfide interchange protein
MKTGIISFLGTAALLVLGFLSPAIGSDAPLNASRPAIYDENADGAKQIADALVVAKQENKRVLLQFGANWCPWCHKLQKLCQTDADIAAKLKEAYVLVLVDVNKGHNGDIDKKYGNPTRFGLPVLVILDADGKALVTQDTSKLEAGDHHDPKKVLAFLNEWAGKKS